MNVETSDAHKDLSKTEIRWSQDYVRKTMSAFRNFINPFDQTMDKSQLYSISSGAPVPDDTTQDLLNAERYGEKARAQFLQERLKTGEKFFEPIKRQNLKTMADVQRKVKLTSSASKVVEYRHTGNIVTHLLVKPQECKLDMAELMKYCLTPVPYCIGTADNYLAKTNKAQSFTCITKGLSDEQIPSADVLTIEDGNALFYYMKGIPGNFEEICEKLFSMIGAHGDVSTDMYKPDSIKALERKRRGISEKRIVKGPKTRKPHEWKKFLCNDDNKEQLIDLMQKCWPKLVTNRKVILVNKGVAFLLGDGNDEAGEIYELRSNQEETDSRVVLYCKYASDNGYSYVRVKSPDSDIFWIHHARKFDITILFDTGHGNKKRLLNITALAHHYSEQMCEALLALHAFSGCDTVSSFKGIGKVKPLKLLLKSPLYCETLKKLGNEWEISEDLVHELEKFTCAMYGKAKFDSVDELRQKIMV